MKIFFTKKKLTNYIQKEKQLGFVPTMGALHLGHQALIRKSTIQCDKTIVSIFVNKPQFNSKNDFYKYPRNMPRDISILKKLKVDYLFIPDHKEIYKNKIKDNIKIHSFNRKLCGKVRPGHFNAVVDVVNRFIKIIKPSKIYFGNKDFQQLKIIEDFIKKNYKNVDVVGCKTIREKNGMAMSSRNFILNANERKTAGEIYKTLLNLKKKLINKKISTAKVKKKILSLGVKKIDYLNILNINKIVKPYKKNKNYRIFIAYYLGSTRLIDNI